LRIQDLTGREIGYHVQVDAGVAYEFLITLCAMGNPDEQPTYEIGRQWFDNVRTTVTPRLQAALQRVGSHVGKAWVNLIGLATRHLATPDVPSLIGLVGNLEPLELRLYLLGFHVPAYRQSVTEDVIERAADGDPEASALLVADPCYFHGEAKKHLGPLLDLTPEETKDAVIEVMERWYAEIFQPREAEWAPILRRDAAAKRLMLETMAPADVIEAASGIQFVPQPGIRQVHLIPQLATRPWVWLAEHDDARLYCYPVADESLGPDASAPPSRLVRLHKALGDEKRLRMLKAIATSSATLQELAERFGLPKSTAHHHLAILRSAGLIRVTSDEEHRYSVRRDVLPEMSTLLDAYLGPDRSR
jgi:DNA-binding transcriptional ArsR family regulator